MLTMREKLQAFSGFKVPFASLPLRIWLWQNDGLFAIQTRERSMSKKEKGGLSFSSSRVSSFMLEEAKKRGATSASLSNLLHPKFTLRFLPVASSLAIGRDQALPTFVVTTNFRTLSFSSLLSISILDAFYTVLKKEQSFQKKAYLSSFQLSFFFAKVFFPCKKQQCCELDRDVL